MASKAFVDLRVNNAEIFKRSIFGNDQDRITYLTFGKTDSWANDASPEVASTTVESVYSIWENMIAGKRLVGSDVLHVTRRYDWASGEVYDQYHHRDEDLYTKKFFVMTDEYNVYKCISNNGGEPSTVKPTSLNTSATTQTSDGYVWKYMYTLRDSEILRFTTPDYIPVKTLVADDGSLQWQVQINAAIGSIENIVITNPGTGYTNTIPITVTVTGDGTSFSGTATVNMETNTIENIVVTDPGRNYTYATVTITGGGGSGATAEAIISPPGGHGSNALYELGGTNILINGRLRYDEEGIIPVGNDFRQICLLKGPLLEENGEPASVIAFNQTKKITMLGTGDYSNDEIVYQGTNLSLATFTGRVVAWYPETNQLLLINTKGTPTPSQSLIGTQSFTSRVVTSIELGKLKPYSGNLLYVDHLKPIIRANDQIEDFKIIMRF